MNNIATKSGIVLAALIMLLAKANASHLTDDTIKRQILKVNIISEGASFTAFTFDGSNQSCSIMLPAHAVESVDVKDLEVFNGYGEKMAIKSSSLELNDFEKDYAVLEVEYKKCVDTDFSYKQVSIGDSGSIISGYRARSSEMDIGMASRSIYSEVRPGMLTYSTLVSGGGLSGSPVINVTDKKVVTGVVIGADSNKCLSFSKNGSCNASLVALVSPMTKSWLMQINTYLSNKRDRESRSVAIYDFFGRKFQISDRKNVEKWMALFGETLNISPNKLEKDMYVYSSFKISTDSFMIGDFYVTGFDSLPEIKQALRRYYF